MSVLAGHFPAYHHCPVQSATPPVDHSNHHRRLVVVPNATLECHPITYPMKHSSKSECEDACAGVDFCVFCTYIEEFASKGFIVVGSMR